MFYHVAWRWVPWSPWGDLSIAIVERGPLDAGLTHATEPLRTGGSVNRSGEIQMSLIRPSSSVQTAVPYAGIRAPIIA